MTCCFIGHRKIDITEALTFQLQQLLLELLTAGVTTFLFAPLLIHCAMIQ